jgi:hypothetical protein
MMLQLLEGFPVELLAESGEVSLEGFPVEFPAEFRVESLGDCCVQVLVL